MNRRVFFLRNMMMVFVFAISFLSTNAQSERIALQERKWKKGVFRHSLSLQHRLRDSLVTLKTGDTLFKYNYFFSRFQTAPAYGDSVKSLGILVGDDKKGNMVLVADKNFNRDFSDDSVYRVSFKEGFTYGQNYINNAVKITIDSVKLINDDYTTIYQELPLTLLAGANGIDYFRDYEQFTRVDQYILDVFVDTYLSGKYFVDSTEYEICLIPHPFVAPYFSLPNLNYGLTKMFVNVFKRSGSGRDSLVQRGVVFQSLIEPSGKKRFLTIANKKVELTNYNFNEKYITLHEVSSIASETTLKGFSSYLVNTGRQHKVNFGLLKKPYNVIMFSGSWCVPCHEAQPAFENLVGTFSDMANFFTIVNERSVKEASAYYKKVKPTWDFYYENLDSAALGGITKRLNVSAFPSFFLINQKGEIIYEGSSSKGIAEIYGRLLRDK